MGKFGKKTHVSLNPLDCSFIFLGSPKIGKTTLMKEVAEKLVGEDGYMFLEMYRESGADMIEGIVSETIPTWEYFDEVVTDIEENKETDYPNLKVVFIDTWDNAILLAEKEALRLWNKNTPENRTDNINQAYSGWQRGQEKAAELLDEMKFRLEQVGIKVSIIMHIKNKEVADPVTEKTYQQVTADVSQKYFNRIKRNADVIAVGYVDRTIVTEKTGKKDIKGKEITKDIVTGEARKIKFRDSGYAIDAGGRLKYIVEETDFNADSFIKAISDALEAEVKNAGVSLSDRQKEDKIREKEAEKLGNEISKQRKNDKVDIERNEELVEEIKAKFAEIMSDEEKAAPIKAMMKELGVKTFTQLSEKPTKKLEEILAVM